MTARFAVDRIRRLAVLGAGTMGHGIAQVAATCGLDVQLYDVTDEAAAAGRARVQANLDKGVSLGKVEVAARDAALARIEVTADLAAACTGVDLVIEAVPEQFALKVESLSRLERAAPAAVVASNTSSFSIDDLGSSLRAPDRFLGLHFFNPVPASALVEVVRGAATSEETLRAAQGWVEALGKTAVTVADAPGFASSRRGNSTDAADIGVSTPVGWMQLTRTFWSPSSIARHRIKPVRPCFATV